MDSSNEVKPKHKRKILKTNDGVVTFYIIILPNTYLYYIRAHVCVINIDGVSLAPGCYGLL